MGDDLLATVFTDKGGRTAAVDTVATPPHSPLASPLSAKDQLESARILHGEGLDEEAKKILRHLLVTDPRNVVAQQALQAILDQELRGLLDGSDRFDPRAASATKAGFSSPQPSSDEILADLDRDLGLGVLNGEDGASAQGSASLEAFLTELESALAGSSEPAQARDRIDLGIAYLEMGSPSVAEHCFRMARQGDQGQVLAASALLAQAQLSSGRALEALGTLQQALKIAESADERERVELLYLIAQASVALDRRGDAEIFYSKVREIEPGYRDVEERLRGLRATAKSK
jgi:tetratricopeptide (TPR) repeat protein